MNRYGLWLLDLVVLYFMVFAVLAFLLAGCLVQPLLWLPVPPLV